MAVNKAKRGLAGCILPLLIATWFYAPALFEGRAPIYGEIVSHGIPLLDILSGAIHGGDSALWTDKMYGGHPIFAEGQGGYAHPLNLIVTWLFPPVIAYSVLAWLGMLLSGIGTYLMCRSFGCSRISSLFAQLALILSPLWVHGQSNLSVGATITWVPWALWSMNCWLKRTDLRSAGIFGLVMSLMVLAGYPQIVHGTLIYMVLYIALNLVFRSKRDMWLSTAGARLSTGTLAVVICLGLSAVQLFPLVELIGNSLRSEGVELFPLMVRPVEDYLRGSLYTYDISTSGSYLVDGYWPGIGCLLVCVIASTAILQRKTPELVAHGIATLVLLVLGICGSFPLFAFIYENGLIPGLNDFRVMYLYLYPFMVGVVVLSALSLDSLVAAAKSRHTTGKATRPITLTLLLAWFALWIAIVCRLHSNEVASIQYVTTGLWLLGTAIMFYFHAGRLIPVLAVLLLSVEAWELRNVPFNFYDANVFETPETVAQIQRDESYKDFKVADTTIAALLGLTSPRSPRLEPAMRKLFASMTPSTNVLWGLSSIDGNTGLPLQRRALAEPVIQSELAGQHSSAAGFRLIDFLSVKYLAVPKIQGTAGFKEFYRDSNFDILLVENPHARPRFQVFHEVIKVDSIEAALQALSRLDRPVLILDSESSRVARHTQLPWTDGVDHFDIRAISDRAGNYNLALSATKAAWLFIADANYPGWNAYLDGKATDLFSAQVLGKAVFIPAGQHELRVVFEPTSFRFGLIVSLLCLLALVPILFWQRGLTRIGGRFRPRQRIY